MCPHVNLRGVFAGTLLGTDKRTVGYIARCHFSCANVPETHDRVASLITASHVEGRNLAF